LRASTTQSDNQKPPVNPQRPDVPAAYSLTLKLDRERSLIGEAVGTAQNGLVGSCALVSLLLCH